MKMSASILACLLLVGLQSQAARVLEAKLDSTKENLVIDVQYGGGCKEHTFELKMLGCAESYPVQCQAEVVDLQKADFCEALGYETVVVNLAQAGLKDKYYSGASITFKNSDGVTVNLPGGLGDIPSDDLLPSIIGSQVTCTTHMGSTVNIYPENSNMSLTTADGKMVKYELIDKNVMILESYPSIEKTQYKMDDGRWIVTQFMDLQSQGTGYFIRTDKTTSPSFTCTK